MVKVLQKVVHTLLHRWLVIFALPVEIRTICSITHWQTRSENSANMDHQLDSHPHWEADWRSAVDTWVKVQSMSESTQKLVNALTMPLVSCLPAFNNDCKLVRTYRAAWSMSWSAYVRFSKPFRSRLQSFQASVSSFSWRYGLLDRVTMVSIILNGPFQPTTSAPAPKHICISWSHASFARFFDVLALCKINTTDPLSDCGNFKALLSTVCLDSREVVAHTLGHTDCTIKQDVYKIPVILHIISNL